MYRWRWICSWIFVGSACEDYGSGALEPDAALVIPAPMDGATYTYELETGNIDISQPGCDGSEFCLVVGERECSENPSQIKVCTDVGTACLEWQLEFCGAEQVCVSGLCVNSGS